MLTQGRVLILDDEDVMGRTIALMARHHGLEALSVTTSEDFFAAIDSWRPTHIVVDLLMPGMDGVQVLQRLAELSCAATIAISSGVGSRVLRAAHQSAMEHGLRIACVLPKPISLAELGEFLTSSQPVAAGRRPKSQLAHREVTLEDIRSAIEYREFDLHYQPKIACGTRELSGFEALIRWSHPELGPISPDQFIPLCEREGLIGAVTDYVVDRALEWRSSFPAQSDLSVSINISAKTLGSPTFPDEVEERCRRADVQRRHVVLEVTETAAMDDQLLALDMFTRLRMKGFHVSIDDFGMGNSSLALLARLPFSEIKIDKSFSISATNTAETRAIIKSTVELSHSLDLQVVTEGVEDGAMLGFLEGIGCDYAQGYYIARPMPAAKLAEWMNKYPESIPRASDLGSDPGERP